jgi:hypothetical protein
VPSGHLISAAQPAWHRAQARISARRQPWSVHSTSAWRCRGSCLVLLIITPAGMRRGTGSTGSLLVITQVR